MIPSQSDPFPLSQSLEELSLNFVLTLNNVPKRLHVNISTLVSNSYRLIHEVCKKIAHPDRDQLWPRLQPRHNHNGVVAPAVTRRNHCGGVDNPRYRTWWLASMVDHGSGD